MVSRSVLREFQLDESPIPSVCPSAIHLWIQQPAHRNQVRVSTFTKLPFHYQILESGRHSACWWPRFQYGPLTFFPRFMFVLIMATNRPVTLVSGIHSVVLLRWMRQFHLKHASSLALRHKKDYCNRNLHSLLLQFNASEFHVDLRNNHINRRENLHWK